MKSGDTEIRSINGHTVRVAHFEGNAFTSWIVDVLKMSGWVVLITYHPDEHNFDYYFDEAGAVL